MGEQSRREIVELAAKSPHAVGATVKEIGISKSSYYRWRAQLQGAEMDANLGVGTAQPRPLIQPLICPTTAEDLHVCRICVLTHTIPCLLRTCTIRLHTGW